MPARKWSFDFESKPEKWNATTAPAAKFYVRNRNLSTLSARRPEQDARALENPLTRFVMERQSLCHLRSDNWTEEQIAKGVGFPADLSRLVRLFARTPKF
jgi:hypothetical protein